MKTARILVWDLPVRVFHWILVICFAGAWITAAITPGQPRCV